MNHQPFNLLIYEEDLSAEQKANLLEHLDSCSTCEQEYLAWQVVRKRMASAELIAPQNGFTARWQQSLASRQLKEQHRQIRRFFLLAFTTILLLMAGMGSALFWSSSPARLIVTSINTITDLMVNWTLFQRTIFSVFKILPLAIPLSITAVVSLVIVGAVLVWITAIYRIFSQGAVNYENHK
jgi:hypothetical protein